MRASLAELAGLPLLIHTPVWEPRSILCPVQRAPTVFRRTWVGHELRALLLQACPRSSSVCRTKAPAESSEAQLSLGLRNLHLHLSQVRGGCGHEHRARSLAQSAPYRGCSGRLRCVSTVRLSRVFPGSGKTWRQLRGKREYLPRRALSVRVVQIILSPAG